MSLPILYSLRNCPFAMRARIAIYRSQLPIELREVNLKNKPERMIEASPKATVPTLVLTSNHVIDESLDVMLWALKESDPDDLFQSITLGAPAQRQQNILSLINLFDAEFKGHLEQYKCAKRYHETNLEACRKTCEQYIQNLEERLSSHTFLIDDNESLADIALLPFIRQFAKVERQWYLTSPYPLVKKWLNQYLQSAMFTKVMAKYPLWSEGSEVSMFSGK